MEFKVDTKYVAALMLKGIISYLVALVTVIYILHTDDPEGFIGITLAVSIGLFIYNYPKKSMSGMVP